MHEFVRLALTPNIRNRALKVGLLVGTLLGLINHGPALLDGSFSWTNTLQLLVTYLVPYGVATYSGVGALRSTQAQ